MEINPEIAGLYKESFPDDKVIIADAHQYLLDHYKEFDFIWSSPPCQSHSRINNSYKNNNKKPRYVDMSLYQEIIFLNHFAECKWVVENVIPFYKALIEYQKVGRHYFWANFRISDKRVPPRSIGSMNGKYMKNWYARQSQEERNAVNPSLGLHILSCAFKEKQRTLMKINGG